jgi:hypothetical protein
MKTVRAANVSATLRRAGYAVLRSGGRMDRGIDGIRVRQSEESVSVSIWGANADGLVAEIRPILEGRYRVSERPTSEEYHAKLWVFPKD